MVQSTWPEKKNSNIWLWPQQETTALAGEKRPIKLEESPVNKRRKSPSSQTTTEWNLEGNEFLVPPKFYPFDDEPSPLGLQLKKSSSLLELIQTRVFQGDDNSGDLLNESLQVENKKDVKARVGTSGPMDKLKASNFPALLLRIGKWEYVSKHEGDLVGKCYFAKHKLVWEILDGGLKNKIEIQWADIVGLNANCPDTGPGSLTIVLGKQPLFFRETDPQPRKHTLWQATCDFTDGEASTYWKHYLQCSKGVINKHYEKLIQCDTRLKFLSRQPDIKWDSRFAPNSFFKDPNISCISNGSKQSKMSEGSTISGVRNTGTLGLVSGEFMKESRYGETESLGQGSNTMGQVNTTRLQRTMLISDLINHIGHCISDKKQARISPFSENISGGGNSLCCLGQDRNDYSTPDSGSGTNHVNGWNDGIDNPAPDCNPDLVNENGMSRKDSFTDLLYQLPRITSLPRFFV